jgi:hypothetical protein
MIQHVVKSRWVVVLRRFPEMIMTNFTWLAVLALPLFIFGMHDVFHWTHAELYDPADPTTTRSSTARRGTSSGQRLPGGFPAFFWLRMVFYFALWIYLSRGSTRSRCGRTWNRAPNVGREFRFTSAWGIPSPP